MLHVLSIVNVEITLENLCIDCGNNKSAKIQGIVLLTHPAVFFELRKDQ